jgi:O-antigen/teichoic acid export membrane protein
MRHRMTPDTVIMAADGVDELTRRIRGMGRGAAATLAARVVDVGATYAFFAVIAHSLNVADFGRVVLGFTIVQTAAAVARIGLDQALLSVPPAGTVNAFGARVVLMLSVAAAMVAAAGFALIGHPFPTFGLLLAVSLPAVAVGQFVIAALRARSSVTLAAVAESVVQPCAAWMFAFVASVVAPSRSGFVGAFLLSWIVTLPFALHVEWRGSQIDRAAKSAFLRTGRSMLGVAAFQQIATSADILLIGILAAPVEVGQYAVAQKIAAAFLLLHGAFANAATPFLRPLADDRKLIADSFQLMTRWLTAVSLPLFVITAGAPALTLAMFGGSYATDARTPLFILSLAGMVLVVSGPAGAVLLCCGQAPRLLRVTIAGAVAIIVCVALLASEGAIGVAIGVLAGRLIARILLVASIRRGVAPLRFDRSLLLILAGGFAGVLVTRVAAPWLGSLAASGVGCAVAATVALIALARGDDFAVLRAEFTPAVPQHTP